MFIHLHRNLDIVLIILFYSALVCSSFEKYSFGFEYEDAVVYTWYALDTDVASATHNYRTSVKETVDADVVRHYYPGHYVTYGLFLKIFVTEWFDNRPDYIHKFANALLLIAVLFLACITNQRLQALLLLTLISTQYVFAASLAENLSFFLAFIMLLFLVRGGYSLAVGAFVILILVKRDALIYLFPLCYFICKNGKRFHLVAVLSTLGLYWLFINPFHTEYIESAALEESSFSLSVFTRQFPYYMAFAISPLVTPLIFVDCRKNQVFLITFIAGVMMYSFHYRSFYILKGLESFTEFHSWRYLYNLIPLLMFVDLRVKRNVIIFVSIFLFTFNQYRYSLFISEEDNDYRSGEYINSEFYIKSELNRLFLEE